MRIEAMQPLGARGVWPQDDFSLEHLVDPEIAEKLFAATQEHGVVVFRNVPLGDGTVTQPEDSRYIIANEDDSRNRTSPITTYGTLFPHVDSFSKDDLFVLYKPIVSENEPVTRFIPYEVGQEAVKAMLRSFIADFGGDENKYASDVAEAVKLGARGEPLVDIISQLETRSDAYREQSPNNTVVLQNAAELLYAVIESDLPLAEKQSAITDFGKIAVYNPKFRDRIIDGVNHELEKHQDKIYTHHWEAGDVVVMTGSEELMHQKLMLYPGPNQTPLLRIGVRDLGYLA